MILDPGVQECDLSKFFSLVAYNAVQDVNHYVSLMVMIIVGAG
jgi:hypothetical protein